MAALLTFAGFAMFLLHGNERSSERKQHTKRIFTILFLTFALFSGSDVFAFRTEKSKKIEGKFDTSPEDWCVVKNKFGEVRIVPSENNTLYYEVNVRISARNDKKAQEMLDGIGVSAQKEGKYVRLTTEFSGVDCNSCEIEVNYLIKMPLKLNLDLQNKFGNADISPVQGKAILDVKHGRLYLAKLSDKHENLVNSEFGSVDADDIGTTSLTLRHGNAKINRASKSDFIIQHSNLKGGNFSDMKIDAKHSNLSCKSAENIAGTLSHSVLSAVLLLKSAKITAKHSSIDFDEIHKNFENISVETSFGNVSLIFQTGTAYQYKLASEFGNIKMNALNNEKNIHIVQNNSTEYGGKVNGGGKANVQISSRHGNISVN